MDSCISLDPNMGDECSPSKLAQGRPQAFTHWRMNPLFLLEKIANWYHNKKWNYFFLLLFFFVQSNRNLKKKKKTNKQTNKHCQHKQKYPKTNHNQDIDFLCGKLSNEKGKTTGPSLVKNLPLLNNEFTTIFSKQMLKTTKTLKNTIFGLQQIYITLKLISTITRTRTSSGPQHLNKWREISKDKPQINQVLFQHFLP